MAELHQVKLGNGTYDAVTKTYVDEKIAAELEGFDKLDYKVADSAPTPTTVVIEGQTVPTETGIRYLVAHPTDDSFEEYVLIDGTIYDIGSTSNVDLSGYATTTVTDALGTRLDALEAAEVDHIELTQAQYDALTPAEKNNGTVYFITDAEVATVVDQTYDATSPHAQSGTAVAEALAQITIAVMSFFDGTNHLVIPVGAVKEVDVSAYNVPSITTTQGAVKYSTEFEYYCIGGLRQYIKLYGTRINANFPAFTTSGTDAKVNTFHVDTETQNGKIVKYIFDPRTVPNQIVVTRIIVSRILD